ncbi:MAG: hypothetical protein GQE15_36875 [Archangiaceae bacterium]|nr:hypothetical protein [Archangiaceae bacterium]
MRMCVAVVVSLCAMSVVAAPKTEAEKQRTKAEKKLEAFTKEYDPSKNLARKGPELEKDIADLDKELDALAALDAAGATELKPKRDAAVAAAKEAVGGAAAGKAAEEFEKKLAKVAKDFDPEKKNLANADAKQLEKAKKELDDLLAKLDEGARAAAKTKRDELFATIEKGVGDAQTEKLRKFIEPPKPVAPANGAEAIAPMKPTWCEGVLESFGKSLDSQRPGIPTVWQSQLTEGILFSCLDPDWDVRQQVVAAFRQTMSNQLSLTAAQNERLMFLGSRIVIAGYEKTKTLDKQSCDAFPPLEEGTAAVKANRLLERRVMGCGNAASHEPDVRLLDLDTPGGLTTQLAMAGFIQKLIPSSSAETDDERLRVASDIAVANTVPLDVAAFEKELAGLNFNVVSEAKARLAWLRARAIVAVHLSSYKKLNAKLPGLTKLVIDVPTKAAQEWATKQAPADKPVLDLVLAMESQTGPMQGCAKKLWPFFVKEMEPQKNAKLSDVRLSGLLAWALAECASRDPDAGGMEPVFSSFAERTTPVRGPFTAAYLAYVDAFNEAGGSQKNAAFDESRRGGRPSGAASLPEPLDNPIGEATRTMSMFGTVNSLRPDQAFGTGVVKAVEKKGEAVKLTFRTEKYKVPDLSCVETNKIDRILADGTILYRRDCKIVGEHEETSTIEPVELPGFAAAGVGPGSFVALYFMPINSQGAGKAFLVEAWDSKARGKRTSLFGLPQ